MKESTSACRVGAKTGRKGLLVLLSSLLITTSLVPIFMNQEVTAGGKGLRVLVHGGQGQVCVESGGESAGCRSASGGTMEFEFSPGAVGVGDSFEVCDDDGCETGTNGEEKAPEHIYLGGGSGGGSSDRDGNGGSSGSQRGLKERFCDALNSGDLALLEVLVKFLGYSTVDAAARGLCNI
jgi:hypothetical protein